MQVLDQSHKLGRPGAIPGPASICPTGQIGKVASLKRKSVLSSTLRWGTKSGHGASGNTKPCQGLVAGSIPAARSIMKVHYEEDEHTRS